MKIIILEGYKNPYAGEYNSVSLKIHFENLKKYQNEIINNNQLFEILSKFIDKYKSITFYHTFRLSHPIRYFKSKLFKANSHNLYNKLQKSLITTFLNLKNNSLMNSDGTHFINIKIKQNDKILHLKYHQIKNITKPTPRYMFIDDDFPEKIVKPQPLPSPKKIIKQKTPQIKITLKQVPEKNTIITQVNQALQGFTKSFDIELRDKNDPLVQLQKSRKAIEYLFNNQLKITKGFKFVETLQVKFIKFSSHQKIKKKWFLQFKS